MTIHVALYQPKIPQNTGNIIRFCANTGIQLHLIHPLGFVWDDKRLARAGMDYIEYATVQHYASWPIFLDKTQQHRRFIVTTKGQQSAYRMTFQPEDMLIFGSEDAGIAIDDMRSIHDDHWLRIPMQANSRSMNLSNTVAMLGYEALRQIGLAQCGLD
ncbi:tRNA (cytidine(34)-2'-O)-methyltransferase [Ostreibacterium oceani]|uniref:tRNA (cytidine(34)-2'-O)-methyltransferase n=1 Tax=Ostreibacterium oceani TaxID=2654998 RepID=A0A6N7F3T3_9GAMM|nr:tRNA (cytidine(34)-2'-O)-methyltransferase [Ostreibacterium oceani]MPV86536.1 tRNA (uridine(34)/cytosine(34)/5-carboxymethylaminomethyluridine(34)-2'-O)-methyltransferase TrmL [Ostreibacterium oceani]